MLNESANFPISQLHFSQSFILLIKMVNQPIRQSNLRNKYLCSICPTHYVDVDKQGRDYHVGAVFA